LALFGIYLKHYRTEQGLSLRRLAEILGVDPSILSRLERGEIVNPSEDVLQKLPAALSRPRAEVYLAAQRITPDLAQRLERGIPLIMGQVAKVLSDAEVHLSGMNQLPPVPISELLTPADEATVQQLMAAGNDVSDLVVALFSGRLSQQQFGHIASVLQHLKQLALPSTEEETP